MVLGFKVQFVEKILSGSKIHTIREDKNNRWKPGNKIHFATGTRTKNYNQFHEGECVSVQKFEIKYPKVSKVGNGYPEILIDGKYCPFEWRQKLAISDGFDSLNDFYSWFNKDFKGKLIHWTDKTY